MQVGNLEVDHINSDGLNNRRSNLRAATRSQNMANQRKQVGRSAKYKGVCLNRGKWLAYIKVNGNQKHLGRFINEEDAARAYDEAAVKYFGEFALVNLPKSPVS